MMVSMADAAVVKDTAGQMMDIIVVEVHQEMAVVVV